MALDLKTFRIRAVSSVFFVVIMLGGLLYNWWSFVFLFTVIMAGCVFEFFRILRQINPRSAGRFSLLSLFYIVLPVLFFIDLGSARSFLSHGFYPTSYSPIVPCTIIFSIWVNDTMAYLVGSFIGKTPLTSISPKKTWEGTVGGAILCVVAITLLSRLTGIQQYSTSFFMTIALLCAVFGTIGDLLESKLKRMAGIKDSGKIMPGHGGFLDRFDSLLVAAPVAWIYIRLLL